MNRKLLLVLSLLFATFTFSFAQPVNPDMARQSTDILTNMRKVELLNQLLPLVLQPNQIQQLLPVLERIRAKQGKLLIQENKDLTEFQKTSLSAVGAGIKGKLPDPALVRMIQVFYKANDIRRQVAMGENIDALMPTIYKTLDKGQQKVMSNSLVLQFFEPDITPKQATEEQKMRVFCREVLLDPLTYDLLVQMGKG